MNNKELIEQAKQNIWQAVKDYRAHTSEKDILNDITDSFVNRLAEDSVIAKQELRELFQSSPIWDEKLNALVINGTRTHNPDYKLIYNLAYTILNPAKYTLDYEKRKLIDDAIFFFSKPNDDPKNYIAAIKELAPKAYAPRKKPSRIFKALCDTLGISNDNAGSEFQKIYAQFADELTTRKIDFKLYVSINPAHFLTMSNPKFDKRGDMLTSCHSFNSTEYRYNCGCTGYARDKYTFIVFTASDPNIPETLNNRKTTRQIFAYKPENGLLLQSRLYNTYGGTSGVQEESKLYRDLIQREISELENVPNLWKTHAYFDNKYVSFLTGKGFGGYPDWTFKNFDAKISIRSDHADDYKTFDIETYGLCVSCGCEIENGLYCCDCRNHEICDDCEEDCEETYSVHDSNGDIIYVCEHCRDNHYTYCDNCDEYYPSDDMTCIANGDYICPGCLEEYYSVCDEYYRRSSLFLAVNDDGEEIQICEDCRDNSYTICDDCGRYVHNDNAINAYDDNGNQILICPDCRKNYYEECEHCETIYHENVMEKGLCSNCRNDEEVESA